MYTGMWNFKDLLVEKRLDAVQVSKCLLDAVQVSESLLDELLRSVHVMMGRAQRVFEKLVGWRDECRRVDVLFAWKKRPERFEQVRRKLVERVAEATDLRDADRHLAEADRPEDGGKRLLLDVGDSSLG